MNQQFLVARAKISGILDKTEIGKIVFARIDDVLHGVDNVINKYVPELGKEAVKIARKSLMDKSPGGHKYVYLTPEGSLITKHTSGGDERPPNTRTGLLSESISYTVNKSDNSLTFGVSSYARDSLAGYYIPLKGGKQISKKNPAREALLNWVGKASGAIIVDGRSGTPVSEYAKYLEQGFTVKRGGFHRKPFLEDAIKQAKENLKDDLNKKIKVEVEKRTGRKLVNHIRIKINT
jgi:hypothetical protein